jgi:sterol desaturase/sphingolipid hydroxylase (fatty acid hydroxylase superfamily)
VTAATTARQLAGCPESSTGAISRTGARRATWVLALAIAVAGIWLVGIGWDVLWRAGNLGSALRVAQGRMVGPVLLATVVALFLAERRWPAVARPARSPAHLVDAGYLLLFALIAPLITLLDTGFAVVLGRYAPFLLPGRLPVLPQIVVVVLTLVGIDALNWAAHLLNHKSGPLWRYHALHHSQEDMSVLTTFRTHPLAHVSYLIALLPALVLGASGVVPAAGIIAYGCLVTLPHANLRWTFGSLGGVLVSPAYHRLHHSLHPVAGRPAVNFGFVLVCWDRLAGRAVFPDGGAPVATGIMARPVPVEQSAATAAGLGRVFLAQLAQPLRPDAAMDGRP